MYDELFILFCYLCPFRQLINVLIEVRWIFEPFENSETYADNNINQYHRKSSTVENAVILKVCPLDLVLLLIQVNFLIYLGIFITRFKGRLLILL